MSGEFSPESGECWSRLPREPVDASSLEARLDGEMGPWAN